jgi:hypothetical protein
MGEKGNFIDIFVGFLGKDQIEPSHVPNWSILNVYPFRFLTRAQGPDNAWPSKDDRP